MKYVIKEVKSNAHYVKLVENTVFFDVAFTIDEASKFSTIEDCISAIIQASKVVTLARYTIVGVKESMKIHYEEVEL